MVQLVMKMAPTGCPEWFMVELQGDLETKSEAVNLGGKFIGDLHFTNKREPILIIGHHILYGKVAKMEKPFAVLDKTVPEDIMEVDGVDNKTDYVVKAIVKKKLIFKTRPKPIIANVPKKI